MGQQTIMRASTGRDLTCCKCLQVVYLSLAAGLLNCKIEADVVGPAALCFAAVLLKTSAQDVQSSERETPRGEGACIRLYLGVGICSQCHNVSNPGTGLKNVSHQML